MVTSQWMRPCLRQICSMRVTYRNTDTCCGCLPQTDLTWEAKKTTIIGKKTYKNTTLGAQNVTKTKVTVFSSLLISVGIAFVQNVQVFQWRSCGSFKFLVLLKLRILYFVFVIYGQGLYKPWKCLKMLELKNKISRPWKYLDLRTSACNDFVKQFVRTLMDI